MIRDVEISRADLNDVEELSSLLNILFSMEAEFTPDKDAQMRGLGMIIEDPDTGFILKAVHQNQIVGMVNILFTVSTALGKRVAILEDLVIHPDYRRNRIASELIRAVERNLLEFDIGRLTLLTDDTNAESQSFYLKNGFFKSEMVVFRKLEG